MKSDQAGTISTADAAKLLMISPRTVRRLSAEGWFERVSRDRYSTVEITQGYFRYLKSDPKDPDQKESVDRLSTVKAEAIEQRTSMMSKSLVHIVEIEAVLYELLSDLQVKSKGIGSKVTDNLVIASKIEDAFNEHLERSRVKIAAAIDVLGPAKNDPFKAEKMQLPGTRLN